MINFHMGPIIGLPIYQRNRKTDVILRNNPSMNTLGSRLKACRKEIGLKQEAVCARVGISQGTLSELENDKYPTSSFVPHLAVLYGVEALWLAEGKGQKQRSKEDLPLTDQDKELLAEFHKLDAIQKSILIVGLKAGASKRHAEENIIPKLIERGKDRRRS